MKAALRNHPKMKFGGGIASSWPPQCGGSYDANTQFPIGEQGTLKAVEFLPAVRFGGGSMRRRCLLLLCGWTLLAMAQTNPARGQPFPAASDNTVEIPSQAGPPGPEIDTRPAGPDSLHFEGSDAYMAAAPASSSQVHLSPDGRTLEGYVAGLPFPMAGSNRPRSWRQEQEQEATKPDSQAESFDLQP